MVLNLSSPESRVLPPSGRVSYSGISDVLQIPNLIQVQLDSFNWFRDEGLKELLAEISPITDFTGNKLELHFNDYQFGAPKYAEAECRERDLTYAAPLRVDVQLIVKETGEIKEQNIFMGDFPIMTQNGTFVINGAERVVVSQLVRSPGVYFDTVEDPTTGRDLGEADSQPWGLARVRDVEQGRAVRQDRPKAEDPDHHVAPRDRLRLG